MKKKESALVINKKFVIISAVVLIVAVVLVVSFVMWRNSRKEQEKIEKGITYLKGLEKQDMDAINSKIDAVKAEMSLKLAETDENAVWTGFGDAVILGDSRAVGFSFYELLPTERVLAQSGGKITDISEVPAYLDHLKKMNPKQIFLCFGLNDVRSGLWTDPAAYTATYIEQIHVLARELPDSVVYINSILPAVGSGLQADPVHQRIGEYNAALSAMAEEQGYRYIDNTQICEEHVDLYQPDGLHMDKEFYKYWAANMLAGVREQ